MKINLDNIDRTQFMVHPHEIGGEVCYLIQPQHIGCKFTQENKIFRSSLWNTNGELISASLPKFVNFGENPENFPVVDSLDNSQLVEKLDGSLLCVSRYKDQNIIRTRGTVDATKLDSGAEIAILQNKYPLAFSFPSEDGRETWTENYSFIYEWTGKQKIVINYGEDPNIHLIGIVNHKDYSLWRQEDLDWKAKQIGVKRPKYYNYGSISEMIESVKKFEGIEGVCLYANGGQSIFKLKADKYLLLHRLKSELSSFEKVVDLWLELKKPSYQEYYDYICNQFDFEIAENCAANIKKLCEIYVEFQKTIAEIEKSLDFWRGCSRKEAAMQILAKYKENGFSGIAFQLLDGRGVYDTSIKSQLMRGKS